MIGKSIDYNKKYSNNNAIWGKPHLDSELKRYLNLIDIGNVLDLGIGEGNSSIILADLGFNVTGVDNSDKALNIFSTGKNDNLSLIKDDIRNFKIQNNYYDLIMSRAVLHFLHKDDVKNIIYDIKSNLKNNVLVYITVFSINDDSMNKKLANNDFKKLDNNIFHNTLNDNYMSYFTKDEILELFNGFETILILDEYSLDLNHGEPHYHGIIKYIGKKFSK